MAISLTICNLALGDVRAPSITDIGEASIEAQNCARYYPHCLALLLDDYTWSFSKKVATLSLLGENARASEWTYAYALPADCAQAIRLLPEGNSSAAFARYNYPYDRPVLPAAWQDFAVEAGVLYCHVEGAVLEYSSSDAEPSAFPPLFSEALRKLLAANLAVPLRDSQSDRLALLREAELARQAAIAADMNRAPVREWVDDVAIVRGM